MKNGRCPVRMTHGPEHGAGVVKQMPNVESRWLSDRPPCTRNHSTLNLNCKSHSPTSTTSIATHTAKRLSFAGSSACFLTTEALQIIKFPRQTSPLWSCWWRLHRVEGGDTRSLTRPASSDVSSGSTMLLAPTRTFRETAFKLEPTRKTLHGIAA